MPVQTIPGSDIRYYLFTFDKHGEEREDDPDAPNGRLSEQIKAALVNEIEPVTDVFLVSHGWKGDVPAAKEQYDAWMGAMLACEADLNRIRQLRPRFRPLLIGLHWPSLPWGDEAFGESDSAGVSFAPEEDLLGAWVDNAADKLVDTPRARQALRTIFMAALEDSSPPTLPSDVAEAYAVLFQEAELAAEGSAGAPGADAEPFDAEQYYQAFQSEQLGVSFGSTVAGGILSVLQQLSFWKMKDRARHFGETGAGTLLRDLQSIAGNRDICFHLMGHSFGCIVTSATVAGRGGDAPLMRPVDSLFLVQGALSLWAYCEEIPVAAGKPGYFHSIVRWQKVRGPIVTTQSIHDTAVRKLYPTAAGVKQQIVFALGELPKYGAVGSFGIRGPGVVVEDREMLSADKSYGFEGGKIYNLESSSVICEGGGLSGAHNDIAKPAVAHAFWEAIIR